jgi:hypothetical protein
MVEKIVRQRVELLRKLNADLLHCREACPRTTEGRAAGASATPVSEPHKRAQCATPVSEPHVPDGTTTCTDSTAAEYRSEYYNDHDMESRPDAACADSATTRAVVPQKHKSESVDMCSTSLPHAAARSTARLAQVLSLFYPMAVGVVHLILVLQS